MSNTDKHEFVNDKHFNLLSTLNNLREPGVLRMGEHTREHVNV